MLLLIRHLGQLPFVKYKNNLTRITTICGLRKLFSYKKIISFFLTYQGYPFSLLCFHPLCPRLGLIFIPSVIAKGLDIIEVHPQVLFLKTIDHSVPH